MKWGERLDQELEHDAIVEETTLCDQNAEICATAELRGEGEGLKKTFSSLFRGNREPVAGMRLQFVELELVDAQYVVSITPEDVVDEIQFWGTALVGYVVGPMPKLATLTAFIEKH